MEPEKKLPMRVNTLRGLFAVPLLLLLAGCKAVVLQPAGVVAAQQRDLIVVSTVLMLLIIVPVIVLTLVFAWRYRQSNRNARYEPEWDHSTQLELVIWAAPLLIIIALGAVTWITTHTLDPYRPITHQTHEEVSADVEPLVVQAVAMDWKWLFIYPEYGVATVNELAAPVDRPIAFRITATSVMNSLFIPALAGQVYAMPAMETQLHALIHQPGTFEGFSANYSGAGFSDMRFKFHSLSAADFEQWVAQVRAQGGALSRGVYQQLDQPSHREPVRYYGTVATGLYDAILNMCVGTGQLCMRDMMHADMIGAQIDDPRRLIHDLPAGVAPPALSALDADAICRVASADAPTTQSLR